MRRELNRLPIDGTIVIGEGERDEAPMLFIGEKVGTKTGPKVDIAVDPLEGTTLCAKDMPGSIAVMAMAQAGALLNAPDVYMDKIAIGPGYPKGIVDLDMTPEENIRNLAKAKGVRPADITVAVLDRPRHEALIAACRRAGASLRLMTDGDVAGIIFTTQPEETGIDLYLGSGGAPEGVLAAGALRCVGGQMQGRLILDSVEKRARAADMGVKDPVKKYDMNELASGDVVVAATGVTDGAHPARRALPPERDRDRDGDLSIRDRHGAPNPGGAPRIRQVPAGLRSNRGSALSLCRPAPCGLTRAGQDG